MNCTSSFHSYNKEIWYSLNTCGNKCLAPWFMYIFKASKWQLDVAQPRLNTAMFFRPCETGLFVTDLSQIGISSRQL